MSDARYERTIDHLGARRFALIRAAGATVIGLGGVGSHAAIALARAGLARIRVVDPDLVSWSSLNRHACALPTDVGRAKAEVIAEFISRLRGDIHLEVVREELNPANVGRVLGDTPGIVLDAIDGVSAKVALLRHCLELDHPVVSSMGASSRSDPGQLQVGNLWQSRGCPLARVIRRRLRAVLNHEKAFPIVYSTEPARPPLAADHESPSSPGTPRRQPSLPTLPGIFGYALANSAITVLAGR